MGSGYRFGVATNTVESPPPPPPRDQGQAGLRAAMTERVLQWLLQWWLDLFGGDHVLALAVGALVLVAAIVVLWFLMWVAFEHPGGCLALIVGVLAAVILSHLFGGWVWAVLAGGVWVGLHSYAERRGGIRSLKHPPDPDDDSEKD